MMQVKKNRFFYIFLRKIGSYGFPETNLDEEAGGSAGNSDNEFLHGEGGREKNQLLQIVPD